MVHVVGLDAVESGRGEVGDRRLGHDLPALGGRRVREDGDPARGLDEADRVEGVELVLADIRAAAVGEPVGREGVGDGSDDAEFDEGLRDVRAADGPVAA